jgi:outer membrane protein TolC
MRYGPFVAGLLALTVVAAAPRPGAAQGPPQPGEPQVPREGGSPLPMGSAQVPGGQTLLLGGIPLGQATATVLPLSLADAIARGLRQNLGIVLGEQSERAAAGTRWQSLSGVLPNAGLRVSQAQEKINLEEFGFPTGPGQSPIIGPFNVSALHLTVSQAIFDWSAIQAARAGGQMAAAASHTFKDTRDLVAFMTASLYLQAAISVSRIDAARAQLQTAQALYDRAVSMKTAGVVPGIDVLRAQVQLQSQQQRVIFYENEFAKAKLTLQRAIGIPLGQQVELTDKVPFVPVEGTTLDVLLKQAAESREDLQAAAALVKAADANRQATFGLALPSLHLNADVGRSSNAWDTLLGTYAVAAVLNVPIFQGGRVKGRLMQADAQLRQQQAQFEDLRARVEFEVRSALLDAQAAEQRVNVAKSAADLASQQVAQAHDRFAAGVTSNIEVVQAQEALATATENYLSALYAHNLAKISLARAVGLSEERGRALGAK